jgi:hypothetical protein
VDAPKAAANVGPNGIDHCVVLQYSAFGVTGIGDDQTVITWGIEQKINQAWAETNIGQAIGLITQDWIAKNGTSVNGQSLQQLITDSRDVQGWPAAKPRPTRHPEQLRRTPSRRRLTQVYCLRYFDDLAVQHHYP